MVDEIIETEVVIKKENAIIEENKEDKKLDFNSFSRGVGVALIIVTLCIGLLMYKTIILEDKVSALSKDTASIINSLQVLKFQCLDENCTKSVVMVDNKKE